MITAETPPVPGKSGSRLSRWLSTLGRRPSTLPLAVDRRPSTLDPSSWPSTLDPSSWPSTLDSRPSTLLAAFAIFCLITACRTVEPWSPPKLDRGDWTVHHGQALWKPDRAAAPIAGDFLYATNRAGQVLAQFTKLPFPSILAEIRESQWQVVYYPRKRVVQGRLPAPTDILWLQLPRALAGELVPERWQFERTGQDWRLEDNVTGETLNGYLD